MVVDNSNRKVIKGTTQPRTCGAAQMELYVFKWGEEGQISVGNKGGRAKILE